MAKNFKYSGKRLNLTNLGAVVTSGKLAREQGFIGVPLNHALVGQSVAFALEGVWGLTYTDYAGLGATTIPAGTILYWDTSAGKLTIGIASGDYVAVKAVTPVSATDGSFNGLLLPQSRPDTVEQS